MASVTFKNTQKTYAGGVTVLHDISLEVQDHEFLVLVGPSGCGKSTLLRMLAGLEEITGGEIYIGDRLVNHLPPRDREIAMVFQDYALYPHMTVRENMSFGLKLRKMAQAEIDARVMEAAEILQIVPLLERRPKALSGGQRQRVAIGRAIVRKPKVFLFDEPLSNLDAKLREEMRVEIAKLHNRLNATIVYVTHDQIEAMTLASRIAVMNGGYIQQLGTPAQVYSLPDNKFVAGFIGSPTMNFIEGVLENENGELRFKNDAMNILLPFDVSFGNRRDDERTVMLGVRHEGIYTEKKEGGNLSEAISGKVEVAELLGHIKNLYLLCGQVRMLTTAPASFDKRPGDSMFVWLDLDKVHLFDRKTGKRMG
ncbi:MAG: sn-glycerol-3-phosphate ABC transporter ATP-binding protein UgpC [Elusimicrobiaceae bacterium]|nr:sn-glycerol-3-phosphate ABC transporter ATP-binding protein UgpC [Elusimicrobiaceae bacterium]